MDPQPQTAALPAGPAELPAVAQRVPDSLLDLSRLPPLMTRAEVAILARCDAKTVARAEAARRLRVARRGSGGSARTLYTARDVLAWLNVELPPPPPAPRKRGRPRKAVTP